MVYTTIMISIIILSGIFLHKFFLQEIQTIHGCKENNAKYLENI